MAIHLITGKPGSFKTAYFMETATNLIKEGRTVYFCNVRGLKKEENSFLTIDHFKDWVDVPDGSAVFVDEVQEMTREVGTKVKTEDLPSWMTLLEKHRHRGIDIYLVTQHPMFVHTHIRRLCEDHIHMQRSVGLPFSNKRLWQQVCSEPEDLKNASIQNGCTTSVYRPAKSVFSYYESTVTDTHKFKVPPKLITYGILILLGVSLVIWFGYGFVKKFVFNSGLEPDSTALINTDPTLSKPSDSSVVPAPSPEPSYNPYRPYDVLNVEYEIVNKPVVAGCVVWDNQCTCYSQQATLMDIGEDQCRKWMSGDRPFDYVRPQSQSNPFNLDRERSEPVSE